MLDGIAISIGLHMPFVPKQAKRGLGNLNHEEIETGIGRQAARDDDDGDLCILR